MLTYQNLMDIVNCKTAITLGNFLTDFYGWNFDFVSYTDSDEAYDLLSWSEDNEVNISQMLYAIDDNKNSPVNLEIVSYDPDDEWFEGYIIINNFRLKISCSVFMDD